MKLKPCPFCGADAEITRYGDNISTSLIECTECYCSLETGERGDMIGYKWNKRKHEEALSLVLMNMLERWWPFVHGAVTASDTAKNLLKKASDVLNREY